MCDIICDMTDKNGLGAWRDSHQSTEPVQGYDGIGTYSRDIHHTGASLSQQASLTSASLHCEQFIKYKWHHSKLPVNHNNPFGCWVSRDYDKMTSWGGASENGECATGLSERYAKPEHGCNCDKNDNNWGENSGFLTEKKKLPLKQLRFGDAEKKTKKFTIHW